MISIVKARKRSLGQGNVFTPVCHSVHGGCILPTSRADTHPDRHPSLGRYPLWADPPQADTPLGRTPPPRDGN